MIHLKGILKRNPMEPETAPKHYVSAVHADKVDLDELATSVAERCSLRRADVHGVLVALMDIIPGELIDGKIVGLGQLGSFYINVSSDGVDTEEELSESLVKGTHIRYRPIKKLKKQLRMVDVNFSS